MLSAKADFAAEGGGEGDPRPGGEVVDDLRHAPALVGRVAPPKESSRRLTGLREAAGVAGAGQVAAGDVGGRVVSAPCRSLSKESERMPTVTPLPSTPKSDRASAAASWASPSELTEPRSHAADRGQHLADVRRPGRQPAGGRSSAGLRRHGDGLVAAADVEDPRSRRAQGVDAGQRRHARSGLRPGPDCPVAAGFRALDGRDTPRFRMLQWPKAGEAERAGRAPSVAVANAAPRRMRGLAGVIAWRIDRC